MFDRQAHTLFEVRSVLLFAALTMGSTSALMAQSTALPASISSDQAISAAFARADKNGDQALSADEAKALPAVSQQFTKIDANGDGTLSLAEFTAAMKEDGKS